MPDVSLESREALIAIGGLLSSNVSSIDGPKNIFENCVDQSAFDEQWNMIYDVETGEVKRESCSFCDELYQKTRDETLLKNSFLKDKDQQSQDKFIEAEFVKAFGERIKAEGQQFKHGASLLNQRQ
jgi:hypothetical protein